MSALPPVTLPRKTGRAVLQLVVSLVLILVGAALIGLVLADVVSREHAPIVVLVGAIGILVFGCFFGICLWTLSRPALVIDDAGFRDGTTLLSVGAVPWEQAIGFYPLSFETRGVRSDLVGVVWADERWAWQRMSAVSRAMNRANGPYAIPPGPVSADMLPMSGRALAAFLLAHRRARRPDLPEVPGMPETPPLH